jgi:hypothetical protein
MTLELWRSLFYGIAVLVGSNTKQLSRMMQGTKFDAEAVHVASKDDKTK